MTKSKADLLLLAPNGTDAMDYFPAVYVDFFAYTEVISQIRSFRHHIYSAKKWKHADTYPDQAYIDIDRNAWHLIARDSIHRTLLGCIRVLLFDSHRMQLAAEDVLSIGGIEFADPHAQVVHVRALQQHLAAIQHHSRFFAYVGGLAVSPRGQQVGMGARLGLGAAALMRIAQAPIGVTFAAFSNGAARFIQRIGGHILASDLQPFYCQQHLCEVQLLGLNIDTLDTRTTQIVTDTIDYLRTHSVLAACR
jgi:hypothetical protein